MLPSHLCLLFNFPELGLLLCHLCFDQLVKRGLSVPLLGVRHLECVANDQVQFLCLQKSDAQDTAIRYGRLDWAEGRRVGSFGVCKGGGDRGGGGALKVLR